MSNKGILITRYLALGGTVLLWLPLAAPLFFGVLFWLTNGEMRVDYLMPAEMFPVVVLGGALLVWAALRARQHRAWIGGGLGAAVLFLFGGQTYAFYSGLATGAIEPVGLPWTLVLISLALYALGIAAAGTGGVLLLRRLRPPAELRAEAD
jgi:hypothetical protein